MGYTDSINMNRYWFSVLIILLTGLHVIRSILPKMISPPNVLSKTCMNITLRWRPFEENLDIGSGPIGQYNVWSRPVDRSTWDNPVNVTVVKTWRQWYYASVTTGLEPDKSHVFRVDAVLLDNGVLFPQTVPGIASDEILNECHTEENLIPQSEVETTFTQRCAPGTYTLVINDDNNIICPACHAACHPDYSCDGPRTDQCHVCRQGTKGFCQMLDPCQVDQRPCPSNTFCSWADGRILCSQCHKSCHPDYSCQAPESEGCYVCKNLQFKHKGLPCETAVMEKSVTSCLVEPWQCNPGTYCKVRRDGTSGCYGCHSNCHPDHPCDGPTAEQCRICKNGDPRPEGHNPCQPDFLHKSEECDRGMYKPVGQGQSCTVCPYKMFGPECRYTCHCKDDEECNKVNGDCPSRQCHPDWEGPGCLRMLPKLIDPPSIVSKSCMNITIMWTAFEQNMDEGEGPFGQYNVWFKQSDALTWNNPFKVTDSQDGVGSFTFSITTGMAPDREYVFRVDVVGMQYGKFIRKVRPGNPTDQILNECTVKIVKKRIIKRIACPKKKIYRVVCPL